MGTLRGQCLLVKLSKQSAAEPKNGTFFKKLGEGMHYHVDTDIFSIPFTDVLSYPS